MSGIVRGFMRPSALFDLRTGTFGEITAYSEEHAEEVRVVPLDDATLAGMAETAARASHNWTEAMLRGAVGSFYAMQPWSDVPEDQRARMVSQSLVSLRAALGLEGGA